jgi:tripeptide aminopeptidase
MIGIETLIADTVRICSVAAPTGKEGRRAALVLKMFGQAGVSAELDDAGSVIGEIPGDPELPVIVVAAHLDTVFPDEGEIEVERRGATLAAPGIGDNSAGVAVLVGLARDLPRSELGPVLLVATVGEEGLGDLRGARQLVKDRGDGIDAFLAVEGAMRDRVVISGIGSERLRFRITGPGGHSWGDAGAPSAILGAARLVDTLYGLPLPECPRTSLSVGTLSAGHSVNSIAADATLDLDLRSEEQEAVSDLRGRAIVAARRLFPPAGPLGLTIEGIGSRPAGSLADDHPLLDHVQAAREGVGLLPAQVIGSSTDANIPLSAGIPAVCVGVGFGHDAHKRSETLTIDGMIEGYEALLALVTRTAADPELRRER